MPTTTNHKTERNQFFKQYPEFWSDMYGSEYSLYDTHTISESFKEQTESFAENVGQIFFKTCELLQSDSISDEILLSLGFPKETLSFIRLNRLQSKTVIGRLDSVIEDGIHKVMEFNSDTPTFIYELFYMNGEICQALNRRNPNEGLDNRLSIALKNVIFEAYSHINKKEFPYVVFTSHHENKEDTETVRYLQRLCPIPSSYISLNDLRIIKNEGLFDAEGRKIDVLYRQTFPIEQLILDENEETGEPIGLQLLDLVAANKLAIINPPSAFLMQSKGVMAVIWGLHEEKSPFFSEEEHQIIQKHFLPTYFEADRFLSESIGYVKKPVFGREGDTIEIYDGSGQKVQEDAHKSYKHYTHIYQKFSPLPTTTYKSVDGIKDGHMMFGTFLINGEAGAVGIRVGNMITDNLSCFLPVDVQD